jgi:hypothetical protein
MKNVVFVYEVKLLYLLTGKSLVSDKMHKGKFGRDFLTQNTNHLGIRITRKYFLTGYLAFLLARLSIQDLPLLK